MNKCESFESERLLYREINEQDADLIVKWRSNPEVFRFFRNPIPITHENHKRWYENSYLNDMSRYDYIMSEKDSNLRIGCVGASNINNSDKSFEIFYFIGELGFQGRGLACEAVAALVEKMYYKGNEITYAEIHRENIASIKIIQKLHFSVHSESESFILFKKIRR